jgi:hypothetical protein
MHEPMRKQPAAEREIHVALIQETIDTKSRVNTAFKALADAMDQFSRAEPQSWGIERIKNTSDELLLAHKEMMRVYSNLRDFEIRGVVPPRSKKRPLNLKAGPLFKTATA